MAKRNGCHAGKTSQKVRFVLDCLKTNKKMYKSDGRASER